MKTGALTALLLAVLGRALAAQAGVAARLDARVAPEVVIAVQALADTAAARGLPVEPLIQKALEGGAKGVPADRVIAAVRTLVGQLDAAAGALREAGLPTTDSDAVEAGTFALKAGLRANQVRDLARASRAPYTPAATLRVAATLAALGVPPKETVDLVQRTIAQGVAPSELLDLPEQVQAEVGRGVPPAQAAFGLSQAAAAHAAHGPPWDVPPGKGKSRKP